MLTEHIELPNCYPGDMWVCATSRTFYYFQVLHQPNGDNTPVVVLARIRGRKKADAILAELRTRVAVARALST